MKTSRVLFFVFFLPLILTTACKSQKNTQVNLAETKISDCLALIPDSLFRNHANLGLSPSQAAQLLVDKQIQLEKFWSLELTIHDKENNFISFKRNGSDIGLRYDLKLWQEKKQQYLGICETQSEACCSDSRLNFYRIESEKLIDVTQEKIQPIQLSYFVDPAFIPKNEEINLPYYIELKPEKSSIKVHLQTDAIGLSFDERTAISISENIRTKTINLDLKRGKFVVLE